MKPATGWLSGVMLGLLIVGVVPRLAAAEAGDRVASKTFTYKTTPDGPLEMIVHFPPGWKDTDRRPVIVFFFGGGWENGNVSQFQTHADHLAQRGMVAARADYRVKSRQNVTPDRCVEDAKSAVRWIRANAGKLGVNPDRIVAAGGSAGAHLAACTALSPGLDANGEDLAISSRSQVLVLFNPVLKFDGVPFLMQRIGRDEALGKALSPTLHLSKAAPPTLIFFGTADRLKEQGDEYASRAREVGARAEMFTAEGQPHGFFNRPPWRERTTERMDEFLTTLGYLEPKSTTAENGWVSLFDGKSLNGWTVHGGTARYTVEDGVIVGSTVEGSPNTFLCRGDYRDFELELEVRCDPRLNSGIQVRSHVYEKDVAQESDAKRIRTAGTVYGPQCEIAARERGTAGNFWDEARRTRWLDDWTNKPQPKEAYRDNEWNRYRIEVRGHHYRSWVNGIPCADFDDDRDEHGFIGLQVHGIAKGEGPYQVRWRNVRIRELRNAQ